MTWLEHQRRSTDLAAAARKLLGRGEDIKAERLYEEAATEAERAMALVPKERRVTFGVIAMLAHRLWRRAHRAENAARIASQIRGSPDLFPLTVSRLDVPVSGSRSPSRRKRG